MLYQDRWAVDDPVLDYVIARHDALYYAAMSGDPEALRLYEEVCCEDPKGDDRGRGAVGCGL